MTRNSPRRALTAPQGGGSETTSRPIWRRTVACGGIPSALESSGSLTPVTCIAASKTCWTKASLYIRCKSRWRAWRHAVREPRRAVPNDRRRRVLQKQLRQGAETFPIPAALADSESCGAVPSMQTFVGAEADEYEPIGRASRRGLRLDPDRSRCSWGWWSTGVVSSDPGLVGVVSRDHRIFDSHAVGVCEAAAAARGGGTRHSDGRLGNRLAASLRSGEERVSERETRSRSLQHGAGALRMGRGIPTDPR